MAADRIAPVANGRRWPLFLSLLVAFWCLELLVVQEHTTRPSDLLGAVDVAKYAARRMVLNAAACTFLACLLNRFWLYITFGLALLANSALIVYAEYFGTPLSWPTVRHQWYEGVAVVDYAITLIPWPLLLLLTAALVIKILLRERLRRYQAEAFRRRSVGWFAAVVYVVFAVGLAGFYKPIPKIRFSSPEYAYGYAVAWAAEGLLFDESRLLQLAVEAAEQKSDRLSGKEPPLQLGDRLAIVQVESLDFEVVDARIRGEWVMPFLHKIRTRSMYFAIQPLHMTGTSDADFTVLTGVTPNGKIAPYKIEQFPYHHTIPQLAADRGYTSVALHGYMGSFFHRRPAFQKMGFSKIYFVEELIDLGCDIDDGAVSDEEVLRLSASWMTQSTQPTIHFIVTFTSHGPFNRLPVGKRELFPHPSGKLEAYLNSMRYVDRCLESYLELLPEGTTLVLYGDHESDVEGYRQTPRGEGERVPWLMHRKGCNLAERQRTRDTRMAQSGELQLLDLATHLHRSLKGSRVATRVAPSTAPVNGRF